MYVPEYFAVSDRDTQLELVRQNNFGILVSIVDDIPFATHLPFLLKEEGDLVWLYAHMARANPHWKHLSDHPALAIFSGPHGYISPTWYETAGVPTWNYSAVHMTGRAEVLASTETRRELVEQLSEFHESANPEPWIPDYPDSMLAAIVAFRIRIDRIEAKFKMSQNRPETDKQGVLDALENPFGQAAKEHHAELSDLMRKHNTPAEIEDE